MHTSYASCSWIWLTRSHCETYTSPSDDFYFMSLYQKQSENPYLYFRRNMFAIVNHKAQSRDIESKYITNFEKNKKLKNSIILHWK